MVERSLVNPAISALRDDVISLEAEDDILHDQIATADTAIDTANTEITELQDDVISLEAANVTLNDQIATADNAISTANANITALAYRLEEAEATISAAVATISTLNARVQVLEAIVTPPLRIVFVTSVGYRGGQIGGIAGADLKCQDLAIDAGRSGTFKAWLSNSTGYSPAQDFVQSGGPYVTTTGIQVAENWQDLTDSNLDNPITFDENGGSTTASFVWTGTDETGMPESDGDNFCDDWTSTSGSALVGLSTATSGEWTSSGVIGCGNAYRLYCFEQ